MKNFMMPMVFAFLAFDQAHAFPEWGQTLPTAPEGPAFRQDYDFRGIVALSGCSGSLVRFDDSSPSDQALVLTNGHCVRMIEPGTVLSSQSVSRGFDVLSSEAKKIGKLNADKLIYATMTKTDFAIYRVRETYQQIADRYQIEALTFARDQSSIGTPIEILSGYWKQGFACEVESFAYNLKEGRWLFEDSLRYSRPGCDVFGGTSGSPVIEAGTRSVVAVNNTANQSGRRCEVNNPCEIDESGTVFYKKGYGYAQQTYWVYSCRNAQGEFDLNTPGCLLPRGK